MSVWAWIEHRDGDVAPSSWEALAIGRQIADETGDDLAAILFGDRTKIPAGEFIGRGADQVIISDEKLLASPDPDLYRDALVYLVKERQPAVIVAGQTIFSSDLMAACAVDLKAGLISDVTAFEVVNDTIEAIIPIYSGNLLARVRIPEGIQMLTARAGVFHPGVSDEHRSGEIEYANIPLREGQNAVRIEHFEPSGDNVSLAEAEIIVAGGSACGVEGFRLISELANALGGAVGASRPPVDLGLLSYEHQVGQTGRVVSPELYFAIGISGAMWHLAGMRTSKVIVAINSDRQAHIFSMADFGIVGDLFEFVPALTEAVREKLG